MNYLVRQNGQTARRSHYDGGEAMNEIGSKCLYWLAAYGYYSSEQSEHCSSVHFVNHSITSQLIWGCHQTSPVDGVNYYYNAV